MFNVLHSTLTNGVEIITFYAIVGNLLHSLYTSEILFVTLFAHYFSSQFILEDPNVSSVVLIFGMFHSMVKDNVIGFLKNTFRWQLNKIQMLSNVHSVRAMTFEHIKEKSQEENAQRNRSTPLLPFCNFLTIRRSVF